MSKHLGREAGTSIGTLRPKGRLVRKYQPPAPLPQDASAAQGHLGLNSDWFADHPGRESLGY